MRIKIWGTEGILYRSLAVVVYFLAPLLIWIYLIAEWLYKKSKIRYLLKKFKGKHVR
jgi:hypothetical protein